MSILITFSYSLPLDGSLTLSNLSVFHFRVFSFYYFFVVLFMMVMMYVYVYQGVAPMSQLRMEARGQLCGVRSFPSGFMQVPGNELVTGFHGKELYPDSSCWPFASPFKDPLGLIKIAWLSTGEETWASYTTEDTVFPFSQQASSPATGSAGRSGVSGAPLSSVIWSDGFHLVWVITAPASSWVLWEMAFHALPLFPPPLTFVYPLFGNVLLL